MRLFRNLLFIFVAAVLVASSFHAQSAPATESPLDVLIAGGTVVDGSGGRPRKADVGIRGERIVFVGNAKKARITAARTIDASGLVVAPGFIDPHTHALEYLSTEARKSNVNYLMQGVTTVITGNDGGGPVNTGEILARFDKQGVGTNVALLVGHGAVRRAVLGPDDVQPSAEQLEQMKALVRKALLSGAFGLSSGLFYVPGNFSKTEEVIELARVAAELGGYYDTHLRDESSYSIGFLAAVEEALRIGREAKIRVNISHIKALGPDVWGQSAQAVRLIRQARKQGVQVTADQYPYAASGSSLTASLLPPWAQAGTREGQLARLKDTSLREKLISDMETNLRRRGGADSLLFRAARSPYAGKTLAAVAKERGKPPVETAIELIIESLEGRLAGGLSVASFNMNEKDIVHFMKQDFVLTGSDGSAGHPRLFGTYSKKLREYVYGKKVISLQRFVQASSAQVAEVARIRERGHLQNDFFADVIVFDPKTVSDRSTFEQPEELAVGMKYVFVNGRLAIEGDKYTGALAGQALRAQSAK
jgi:N-acyl-D-aspartate/D-glutamate deacylase